MTAQQPRFSDFDQLTLARTCQVPTFEYLGMNNYTGKINMFLEVVLLVLGDTLLYIHVFRHPLFLQERSISKKNQQFGYDVKMPMDGLADTCNNGMGDIC